MRLLTFLLTFSIVLISYSQDQEKIDSLQAILSQAELSENQMNKTKVELSRKLVKSDLEKGLQLALEVVESQDEPTDLLVEAYVAAAECQFHSGEVESFKDYIDKAFKIGKENNLTEGLKKAYKSHYDCYSVLNREQAYTMIKEGLEFADKIKDDNFSRILYNNRGILEYNHKRNTKEARKWFEKSLEMARKTKNNKKIAGLTMNLGVMNFQEGKYDESLIYYKKSLQALENFDNAKLHGKVLLNIAITKYSKREMDSAIFYSERAIEKYVEAKDSIQVASAYIQIGDINMEKAEYKESIKWLTKALKIYDDFPNTDYNKYRVYKMLSENYSQIENKEAHRQMIDAGIKVSKKLNDSSLIAESYNHKAQFFNEYGDSLSRAIKLLDKANSIYEALELHRYVEGMYLDFGNTYQKMGKPLKAKPYFEKALEVYKREPEKQKANIAGTLSNLGVIAFDLKQYDEAIKYYNRALKTRKELGERRNVLDSYLTLRNAYEQKNDFKNAFKYAKEYSLLKDSIFKEDLSKDLAEMRTKYETEKKDQENKLLQKDNKLKNVELENAELENQKNRTMLAVSFGGGLLVVILALVSYRGYLRKRKDNRLLQQKNDEIQLQNIEIKEKSDEIMDSIRYAQRIQETILPANQLIKSYFNNSFIFYKPKELVSGDFYWMKSIEEDNGDKLMFSAVDCTGHGVPGAFVSIVGHNGLNRAVNEYGLRSPKLILEKLNELVVESFAPSEEMSVKDGMDLAFCMIDESNVLHFAGANNPLWIVSKENTNIESRITTEFSERVQSKRKGDLVLTEIKADKRPIGAYDGKNLFNEHRVQLKEGDTIYVFSDGYADQFGGQNNKKMKSSRFKEILLENYPKLMIDQKDVLKHLFEDWKGDYEQIDDVCVIGYRFEG